MFNEIYSKKRRNILFLISIFLIAILTIAAVETVSAASITIGPTTSGGLKKAISTAKNGDTINLRDGVYTGGNNRGININKNITIQGTGKNVVIDGNSKSAQLFQIGSASNSNPSPILVNLKNLKIKNFDNGYLTTIQNRGSANLRVTSCSFTSDGVSISNELRGSVTLSKSSFRNSRSMPITNYGTMKIANSVFMNNKGAGGAGAIENQQWASMTITNSKFIDNMGVNAGAVKNNGQMTISGSTFNINTARVRSSSGGAIYNQKFDDDATLSVSNCKFKNNIAGKVYNAISNGPNGILSTSKNTITYKDGTNVNILDKGSFNVRGKKVSYFANSLNGRIYVDFYYDDLFDTFIITKSSNSIKVALKNRVVETHRTNESLKSFYKSKKGKNNIINREKARLNKSLK